MNEITDPARELAELCEKLAIVSDTKKGDLVIAERLHVDPWSSEFFQIVFWILDRADFVAALVPQLDYDEDLKAEALDHIAHIKRGFEKGALMNLWSAGQLGPTSLSREHTGPIKMLSSPVRKLVSYPKLNAEEGDEIADLVNSLEAWLHEHQLAESDFIREALIEGLRQFRFRLERTNWLGWGYATSSLREVIAAYMALERAYGNTPSDDVLKVMVSKTGTVVRNIYEKTKTAKDVFETGDFVLRAYGAATLAIQGSISIAGLLAPPS